MLMNHGTSNVVNSDPGASPPPGTSTESQLAALKIRFAFTDESFVCDNETEVTATSRIAVAGHCLRSVLPDQFQQFVELARQHTVAIGHATQIALGYVGGAEAVEKIEEAPLRL